MSISNLFLVLFLAYGLVLAVDGVFPQPSVTKYTIYCPSNAKIGQVVGRFNMTGAPSGAKFGLRYSAEAKFFILKTGYSTLDLHVAKNLTSGKTNYWFNLGILYTYENVGGIKRLTAIYNIVNVRIN